MKIGIDISPIVYGTGVSEYTYTLVKYLLEIDKENAYCLFGGSLRQFSNLEKMVSTLPGKYDKKLVHIPPTLADILFNILRTPALEVFTGNLDVFHSSDWAQPKTKAFKVTTIHDLAPIVFQKETHPKIVTVHRRRLKLVREEVDRIIVPSMATKEDLVNYGVRDERIRVIPEANTTINGPAEENQITAVKKKYKIDGSYIVTVGVGQRKNTERLIKAFDLSKAGKDLKLVLIGRNYGRFNEDRGLRFTGHVDDEEFAALVSGAQVMVYPSLYEGFGLPILEGFKAQVPVVTSNISSMPEVAGDAAILVDPYNIESIADGIHKALRSKKTLIEKGLRQVEKFSWKRTAENTLQVYSEFNA